VVQVVILFSAYESGWKDFSGKSDKRLKKRAARATDEEETKGENMKLMLVCLLISPLTAQDHGQFGLVRWDRFSNPPTNVFAVSTPSIYDLGHVLCIDHITLTARLLDGSRHREGEERLVVKTYTLTLVEQHNGITRPRSLDLGRGRILSIKAEGFPATDDVCVAIAKGER
jgi:hypothetical protein